MDKRPAPAGLRYLRGPANVEDLVQVPDSDWLIAAGSRPTIREPCTRSFTHQGVDRRLRSISRSHRAGGPGALRVHRIVTSCRFMVCPFSRRGTASRRFMRSIMAAARPSRYSSSPAIPRRANPPPVGRLPASAPAILAERGHGCSRWKPVRHQYVRSHRPGIVGKKWRRGGRRERCWFGVPERPLSPSCPDRGCRERMESRCLRTIAGCMSPPGRRDRSGG